MKLKNLLIWLASFLIIGIVYAIRTPNIIGRPVISDVTPWTTYMIVQTGTTNATQYSITLSDMANNISWYFGTLTWEVDPIWMTNSGSYVPWSNIDTGFNNTWSDTIIPSEAAIYNYLVAGYIALANSGDYFDANSGTYYTNNPLGYLTTWTMPSLDYLPLAWNMTGTAMSGYIYIANGNIIDFSVIGSYIYMNSSSSSLSLYSEDTGDNTLRWDVWVNNYKPYMQISSWAWLSRLVTLDSQWLYYDADYSAYYTDRSLIDRWYTDATYSPITIYSWLADYYLSYRSGTQFYNSNLYRLDGAIGLGLTDPQYALDVSGTVQSNTSFNLTGWFAPFRFAYSGASVEWQFFTGWVRVTSNIYTLP